jgi:NAD(P)-dependent dehydrogenase (short-subunit alcohol dehydrogenase family)
MMDEYLNRGIGAGIALRLARDGAKVIINYQSDIKSANVSRCQLSSPSIPSQRCVLFLFASAFPLN